MVDFPAKDTTLPPVERQFIVDRINKDRGDAEEDAITFKRALEHLKDWKIYFWSFNLLAAILPGYAYSYFQPIILTGIGFTNTQSQLLSAPPYILAGILCYTSGWISDKYRIRGPIIAVHQLLTVVGMLITAYGRSSGFRYFGVFLGKRYYTHIVVCLIKNPIHKASVRCNSAFRVCWHSRPTTLHLIPSERYPQQPA